MKRTRDGGDSPRQLLALLREERAANEKQRENNIPAERNRRIEQREMHRVPFPFDRPRADECDRGDPIRACNDCESKKKNREEESDAENWGWRERR